MSRAGAKDHNYEMVQTDDEGNLGLDDDLDDGNLGRDEGNDMHLQRQRSGGRVDTFEDLDEFFKQMYRYYHEKGYWPIVANKVASLFRMVFIVAFATFFIVYLKWEALADCQSLEDCARVGRDLSSYVRPLELPAGTAFAVACYVGVFSLYLVFNALAFAVRYFNWVRPMRRVFEQDLEIPPHELHVMSWDEIVCRYREKHIQGAYQAERRDEPSTAHEIAMRIMRHDNYFIYLMDQGMFDFHMLSDCCRTTACCCGCCSWQAYMSLPLEQSLRLLITNRIVAVNNGFRMDRQRWTKLHGGAVALKRYSRCLAIVVLCLMPFLIVFQIIIFFLRYAQEFHKSKPTSELSLETTSNIQFTRHWHWKFREYNELPHVFERRMRLAIAPTQTYLRQFHNPLTVVLAQTVYFIAGSFIALLLVISLLGDSVMLYVTFGDRNLLWYLSALGVIAAFSRSYMPERDGGSGGISGANVAKYAVNFQATTSALLRQVVTYTHWRPASWYGSAHSLKTRDEFIAMIRTKWVCIILELRSTLFLPWLLFFKLPARAEAIVERIERGTMSSPRFSSSPRDGGIGDVCRPSLFLFRDRVSAEHLSQSTRECEPSFPASDGRGGGTGLRDSILYTSTTGKIEKSLLNFCVQHPSWANQTSHSAAADPSRGLSSSHGGQDLVSTLAKFQLRCCGPTADGAEGPDPSGDDGLRPESKRPELQGRVLQRVRENLSASRVLSDSHTMPPDGSTYSEASSFRRAAPLNPTERFFETSHMMNLPLSDDAATTIYPAAEPQFFWLDKFYQHLHDEGRHESGHRA